MSDNAAAVLTMAIAAVWMLGFLWLMSRDGDS